MRADCEGRTPAPPRPMLAGPQSRRRHRPARDVTPVPASSPGPRRTRRTRLRERYRGRRACDTTKSSPSATAAGRASSRCAVATSPPGRRRGAGRAGATTTSARRAADGVRRGAWPACSWAAIGSLRREHHAPAHPRRAVGSPPAAEGGTEVGSGRPDPPTLIRHPGCRSRAVRFICIARAGRLNGVVHGDEPTRGNTAVRARPE